MITGKSNLEILGVYDFYGRKKRKKLFEESDSYLYTVKIDNLTKDDLEILYYLIDYLNTKRSEYGEEKTTN